MIVDLINMDEEKAKQVANSISQLLSGFGTAKAKDLFCSRFYNMKYKESDFKYLTHIGEYALPAHVRFIPIIRPKIQYLISQSSMMDILYRVRLTDRTSLNDKLEERYQLFLQTIDDHINDSLGDMQSMMDTNNFSMEQMQQQLSSQGQNIPPEASLQAILARGKSNVVNKKIKASIEKLSQKLEQVGQSEMYSPSEYVEILAQKLLQWLIENKDIKAESVKAFEDKVVYGKQAYHVHFNESEAHPFFHRLQPLDTYWSADENVRWIQKCRWAAVKYRYTSAQMVEAFKPYIDKDFLTELNHSLTTSTANSFIPIGSSGAQDKDNQSPGLSESSLYGGTSSGMGYEVIYIYFVAARNIAIKKIPNPYQPDKYIREYTTDSTEVDSWKKEVADDKTKKLVIKEVLDLWEAAVVVGKGTMYARRCPIQNRDENYNIELPIIGPSFNHIGDQPYSIVWATKDIQELYNIVWYHQELMLALSGSKGTVMDDTQRPSNMTRKEWQYQKKLGTLFIEPGKLKAGFRPTGFNQWQSYDDSVSPAIQYLENMKQALDETAATVTGISRQSTAQIVNTDQVGTSEIATRQTQVVTEILYYEHDQVLRKALTRYMNLCRLIEDEGPYSIFDGDGNEDIFKVPKGIFESKQFDCILLSSSGEQKKMQDVKQTMLMAWQKGQVALDETITMYNLKNFKQLEKAAIHFAKKRAEIAGLNAQADAESKAKAKQEEIKLTKEYDVLIARETNQIKQMSVKVDEAKLQLEQAKQGLDKYKIDLEAQIANKDIDSRTNVDMNYLDEQRQGREMETKLEAITLEIDAIQTAMDTKSKEKVDLKKIDLDEKKVTNQVKSK